MKKLLVTLLTVLSLTGCKSPAKAKVQYSDVIVDKYSRETIDNASTWWWGVPMSKQVYFFRLKEYGETEVDKEIYNKYKIGDTYTWEEYK